MGLSVENTFSNFAGTFPNATAINSTGPATSDGTEFIAAMINNWMFGWYQNLLSRAGLTPDEVVESSSASQVLEAMQKGFAGMPAGIVLQWHLAQTPGTFGARAIELNGQGILISSYQDLVDNVYVGDGNNATASAYFKATDATGTTRSTSGTYLILPDTRGYVPRGLDVAAAVDPDGASRDIGNLQADAMQKITGYIGGFNDVSTSGVFYNTSGHAGALTLYFANGGTWRHNFDNSLSTSPNAAKTNDNETRGANFATQFVITY